MALDEAILEAVQDGQSSPTVRFYAWDPPCLSLGYAQSFGDADRAAIEELGWHMVRRPTGGRAILHTDEVTYSIAAPADHPLFANGVLPSYERISRGLLAGLRHLGMDPEIHASDSPVEHDANPVCFQNPGTFEITVQGKKLVGSAQLRRARGVLQHGSIPIFGELNRICLALKYPSDEERSRAMHDVDQEATTVERSLGRRLAWEQVVDHLIAGLESEMKMSFIEEQLTQQENLRAIELHDTRYAHSDWTLRK